MATLAEIEAAIAKAEAAGRKDLADQLRTYADKMRLEQAIAKAEAKGRTDLADQLRAYLPASPEVPTPTTPANGAATDQPMAMTPPRADAEAPEARNARLVAEFEAANPILKGRYKTFEELPKVGESVMGAGGGGKSGGARYTVQPWQNVSRQSDTFGETAGKMIEGPLAAARAFGGGLTGGPSPSRKALDADPLLDWMPNFAKTGAAAIGDAGGAALSIMGAGVAGLTGLAVEAVPGQDSRGEGALAQELSAMAMFAVPELAGASSLVGRAATAAPKVAPKAPVIPDGLAAADKAGIPVMRSDLKPPTTFIGKTAQKAGEMVPIAGTAGMRAAQAEARVDAVKGFISEYVGDRLMPAIDAVTEDFRALHAESVKKYAAQKDAVIKTVDAAGPVPVPKAVAAIDAQIARLTAAKNEGFAPIISELQNFKTSITGQKMTEIEMNRAYIGKVFEGLDAAKIRDAGEKALSAVYGPLKDDMASFIERVGGTVALNKWGGANARLAELADGMKNAALKRALKTGEMSPEVTRQLLFSQKPSDVRQLYSRLNEQGRKAARAAVVQEAVAKAGGLEAMTPDKFKTALAKMGGQIGVFFKGDDLDAAEGLIKALRLTERAARATDSPPTGIQAVPYVATLGLGSAFGFIPGVAMAGTIGLLARAYESVGVRNALKAMKQAKPGPETSAAAQKLESAIASSGLPIAGQAANTATAPDYEALWGRY